jgi:hypothetical protein
MRIALLILSVLSLGACSRSLEKADIIGTYSLDNKSAEYTLELKSNGTYVHSLTSKDGKRASQTGRWEWDSKEEDNELALYQFGQFPGEDIGAMGSGIYCISPKRSWGQVRLPVGGDIDVPAHYFIKQRQE